MIESVELLSFNKINSEVVELEKIELFPRKKRPIKIFSNSNADYYAFKVISSYEVQLPKIIINDFEIIDLYVSSLNSDYHIYESEKMSTRNFLGFNLGVFQVNLSFDSELLNLSTIINKLGAFKEENIQYMYELIASSEFFNLYISKFNRANTLSDEYFSHDQNHFWSRLSIAKELLKETERFTSGELQFTNRVIKSHSIEKYHHGLQVEKEDICWLLYHPNELISSPYGEVYYSGFRYDVNNIKSTSIIEDYNTYENNLLLSCLYSVKFQLSELCETYKDTKLFPHKSIDKIITDTDNFLANIQSKLNLSPPFNTTPEYSNKYLDDIRYVNLFGIISKWYSINNLEYGGTIRTPILCLTAVFEHYCFIVFVQSFTNLGFKINESHFKNPDTTGEVQLIRNNELVILNYEPTISKNTISPLITSRSQSGYYKPDMVLSYFNGSDTIYGVIDAKFAEDKTISAKLGPDIYYKYGLFLHAPNKKTLDFVFAMCPSINDYSVMHDARNTDHVGQIKPALGFFSVPFNANSINEISGIIKDKLLIN